MKRKLHPEVIKFLSKNQSKGGKYRWKGKTKAERKEAMAKVLYKRWHKDIHNPVPVEDLT